MEKALGQDSIGRAAGAGRRGKWGEQRESKYRERNAVKAESSSSYWHGNVCSMA